jgi:DNA-binding PadR family transcriptional regulator
MIAMGAGADAENKVIHMEIVVKKLKEIHPYPKNPRKNAAAVDAVIESINQCGYIAPIIVDEDGVILAGHTRYKALKKLGKKEIEVIVREGLTEEQKRKYRLLDNKTNELADWDFELLAGELDGLDFGELDLDWGFSGNDEPDNDDEAEISEREISQYQHIHYLVTIDVNEHDKFVDEIEKLKEMGAEVQETRNNT